MGLLSSRRKIPQKKKGINYLVIDKNSNKEEGFGLSGV
jgi:hypothetical protein